MSSFIAASLLLALPVFAVPKFDKLGAMEIVPRANYLGGWSQGRDGTGVGCPAASTACDGGPYGFLTLQCCPSGQTCFTTALTAYCCPTSADCQTSVINFPVCAKAGLTMFATSNGYFCCETNEKGVIPSSASTTYDGLCVPADQGVASSQLAKTQTQIGTAATPTGESGSVISSASSASASTVSSASSRAKPTTATSLTSASSGSSSGGSETTSAAKGSSTTGAANSGDSANPSQKSSSSSSKLGIGPIIGIAIGGVAILLLAAILFFLIKRSRNKKHQQAPHNSVQYSQAPMGPGPGIPEVSGVGVAAPVGRKPVASTATNPAYNSSPSAGYVSPISTTPSPGPPGYANIASQPQGQFRPPPPPQEGYNPHANYVEMDSNGYPVNRVELRGQ